MIQQSLFPDEIPNRKVTAQDRKYDYSVYLRRFLRTEGFYNFAKMAEKVNETPEDLILSYHKIDKQSLYALCEGVFGEACAYQETIATFLERTRNEVAFTLVAFQDEKDINNKRSGKRR